MLDPAIKPRDLREFIVVVKSDRISCYTPAAAAAAAAR